MATFRLQKNRNDNQSVVEWPPNPGPSSPCQPETKLLKTLFTAPPPIHAGTPTQPHATIARMSALTLEPIVPYAARANTGKGMPYRVPGWEFRRIGIRTIVFPSATVNSACDQLIPAAISPADNM